MQTHTEADALDHLQKQLESVRTHTRDPNWKGFVALLDKQRRAKEAQLQESAHLLDSGATRTVGGSTGDGGGSSGGASLGVADGDGVGGGATPVGGGTTHGEAALVGGGTTPGGATRVGGWTTPGGASIGVADGDGVGGGATPVGGGTTHGEAALVGGGTTPGGATRVGGGTPAPLPAIPSQGSYPHVRELQRSELRNATTYAPTHAPSAHHTTSALPTSNFSWPAHDC